MKKITTHSIIMLLICITQMTKLVYAKELNKKDDSHLKAKASEMMAQMQQLGFKENKGQMMDIEGKPVPYVLFKAETPGLNIWITETGITYHFLKFEEKEEEERKVTDSDKHLKDEKQNGIWHRVDMILKDAAIKKENIISEDEIPQGVENFYFPHCPNGIFNVKTYRKIIIKNIYEGIDWVLYTNNSMLGGALKYDFIVHPNADPNQIKLIYEGSGKLKIKDNQIEFENEIGKITEGKLFCYQGSESNEVGSKYVVKKNHTSVGRLTSDDRQVKTFSYEIGIQLNNYDKSKTLTIDPQLVWSTFYGGNAADGAMSIDCDAAGNVYITSYIHSTNYPVVSSGTLGGFYQGTHGGGAQDASILCFSNTGVRLWATHCGGSSNDLGFSICTDNANNVFILGNSQSNDFPVQNFVGAYYQSANAGHFDLFIMKLNNAGIRQWATYYGGLNTDYGNSICVDLIGNIYITGETNSMNLPVTPLAGAYNQAANGGSWDGLILKFTNAGALLWGTYLGGSSDDNGYAICRDANGNIFVTGGTESLNFPVVNVAGSYSQAQGGTKDAFVLKLNNADAIVWCTFYGGGGDDTGFSIACDNAGLVYVVGATDSNNFPIQNLPGAFNQAVNAGSYDVFILKFTNAGARLWSTHYGSIDPEMLETYDNIVIDVCDNVYISFDAYGPGLPVKNYSSCSTQFYDPIMSGKGDCFIAKFNSGGALLWATYFGGDDNDFREPLALDNAGNLFITGEWADATNIPSYPTISPGGGAFYSTTPMGSDDTFISKFTPTPLTFTQSQSPNTSCNPCNGSATITLACGNSNYSYVWSNSSQTLNDTSNTNTISGLCAGTYTVTATSNCNQTVTATFTITGIPAVINTSQSPAICTGSSFTLPGGTVVSTAGTYIDTLLSSNGCDSIITTNLAVASFVTSTQSPVICVGQSFTLPGGGIITTAGTYTDTLTAVGGCDSIITTNLTVNPAATFTQSISICNGQSYTLPGGIAVSVAGSYQDTLSTLGGCDSIVTTNLAVVTAVTSTQNPVLCVGNTFTLPGGTVVSTAGTYTDTLTASGGCDSIITTTLTYNPNSTSSQNPSICSNESYTLPSGAIVSTSGTYSDTLTGANGCDSIITTSLIVFPPLTTTISPDITIINGDSTTLTATGGTIYNWSPSNGLNSTTVGNVIAKPTQTTTYCVEITDNNGCKDTLCVIINVEDDCPMAENLAVPNAFSPNGDGVNDEFCLQGWTPCVENFVIYVFDRWGEKVYESKDANFCWEGKNRGKIMEAQVFVYYLKAKYTNIDKVITKKGNISLLR